MVDPGHEKNCENPPTISYKKTRVYESSGGSNEIQSIRTNLNEAAANLLISLRHRAQRQEILGNLATNVATTNTNLDQSKILESLQTNSQAYYTKALSNLNAAKSELKRANMLMFRWTTGSEKTFVGKLGNVLRTSVSTDKVSSGYAIVAGLRTTRYYVGSDHTDHLRSVLNTYSTALQRKITVPLFTVDARQISYVGESDLVRTIQSKLNVDKSLFTGAGALTRAVDRIELEYLSSQFESLMNAGNIEGPTSEKVEELGIYFTSEEMNKELGQAANLGWTTFYSAAVQPKVITQWLKTDSHEKCECPNVKRRK